MPRLGFHSIRHRMATVLLQQGIPAHAVSERLGHSSPGFTLSVYGHVVDAMRREIAEVTDRLLRRKTGS